MELDLLTGQVFCLRNWSLCQNSLKVRLTATYVGGRPAETLELNLKGANATLAGVLLILKPEQEGAGVLFLAPDGTQSLTTLEMTLESTGMPLRNLHLEYRIIAATEAFAVAGGGAAADLQAYSRLQFDRLLFAPSETGYCIQMESTASESSDTVDGASEETPTETRDDLLGNLAADLRLLSCFDTAAEVRDAIRQFTNVQTQAETMSQAALEAAVAEADEKVATILAQTTEEIRAYRPALLEGARKR